MKRLPTRTIHRSSKLAACTVSAAALMLGVSHATTVGLHFQVNYCANPAYTGFPVTLTAFGIEPSGWQNLTEMTTGYSCNPNVCSFMNLSEVISTSTFTGGLNPIPNGSITVNWGASSANISRFGGYGAVGIYGNYAYDGPPPGLPGGPPFPTGEFEVYSAFLRDGINFGPDPATCTGPNDDNDQPGYNVDVVGLKSLFTNTPFVVELIASSDSMQYLTNAFVIDATLSATQSVTYPNTAFPPVNEGGSPWYRGHGGGLSTSSGPLTTDHLKIIGNRAAHGATGPVTGYDNASTISGFILTDQPVITMSPQPVTVGPGDTVTWSAYAIGVPPLAYQWLHNGAPVPGATTNSLTIANVRSPSQGTYVLRVTNAYGSALSSPVNVDQITTARGYNFVVDSNPKGPEHDGIDFGATWLTSQTDGLGANRTGVMSFSGSGLNQITVPASPSFNTNKGTIMFWMLSTGNANAVTPAAIFSRINGNNGMSVSLFNSGSLFIANGGVNLTTVANVADGNWHHVAVDFNGLSTGNVTCYIDGTPDSTNSNFSAWSWDAAQEIDLGSATNLAPYAGLVDDVRFYTRELTATEVASVHSSNALVDTNALVLQLNFTAPPSAGMSLSWQVNDVILQSATKAKGPWTDIGVPGTTTYRVVTGKAEQFFRYRGHTPATLVSNPFLM